MPRQCARKGLYVASLSSVRETREAVLSSGDTLSPLIPAAGPTLSAILKYSNNNTRTNRPGVVVLVLSIVSCILFLCILLRPIPFPTEGDGKTSGDIVSIAGGGHDGLSFFSAGCRALRRLGHASVFPFSLGVGNTSSSGLSLSMMGGGVIVGAEAKWTVSIRDYIGTNTVVDEERIATPGATVDITMTNSDVTFDSAIISDRSIFPGTCTSASQNAYGWNRWKDELYGTMAVFRGTIRLTLNAVHGFTTTETETVTCAPGAVGSGGVAYIKSGTLPTADRYVTFQIVRSAFVRGRLMDRNTNVYTDTTTNRLTEVRLRSEGLFIAFGIIGDVWDVSLKQTLLAAFSCSSSVAADCAWFQGLLANPSRVALTEAAPQWLTIQVPVEESWNINLAADMTISVNLPTAGQQRYGLKTGITLTLFGSDSSFKIYASAKVPVIEGSYITWHATNPYNFQLVSSPITSLTFTEACVRGFDLSATCPRAIRIALTTASFNADAQRLTDIPALRWVVNSTAWLSQQHGYLKWFRNAVDLNGQLVYLVQLASLPDYDIATNDIITFKPPYAIFFSKEPPAANNFISITVTPSPGDVSAWSMPNATQNLLWRGGVSMMIRLGGESFKSTVPASIRDFMSGSLGSGPTGGFDNWKSCVITTSGPNVSAAFAKKADGVTDDRQTLLITFAPCLAFVMSGDEIVTFSFPNWAFASNLLLNSQSMLRFPIEKSPGMFIVNGNLQYLEQDIHNGSVTFSITLLGGEFLIPNGTAQWDTCLAAFGTTWISNVADPLGWSSATIRNAMLRGAITRDSSTAVTIRLNSTADYDTRRGENINITTFPGACLQVGRSIFGSVVYALTVRPERGRITLGYQYTGMPTEWSTELSESMMRRGGFDLIVQITQDTFDDDKAATYGPAVVFPTLTTPSLEPLGFRTLKNGLIDPAAIVFGSRTVRIPIRPVIKFDIRNNESLMVGVDATWTTSWQDPLTPRENIFFTIYKSAGDIVLDSWFGSNRSVTEDDIRAGRVWFKFGLLGDQWRAERGPYISAFNGTDQTTSGFLALREQLIPTADYFVMTSGEGYEYLELRLQASDAYDIAASETITISFPRTTVVGDLAPTFTGAGVVAGRQTLVVHATAGRAIISGMTTLNEKMIRQGGVELYLTLLGEKWTSDAALCVRQGMKMRLASSDGHLNTSILPYSTTAADAQSDILVASDRVIRIPLRTYRGYDIPASDVDTLQVEVAGRCVRSGTKPRYTPMRAAIQPTEGELRLVELVPAVVTEETMRRGGVKMTLQIDGDRWNTAVEPSSLLAGFGSLSSTISEPSGFYANRVQLLKLGISGDPSLRVKETTLDMTFEPSENYNIQNDEVITFSVADARFLVGGVLPSPATVSFTVHTVVRRIILIIDGQLPNSMKDGRYNTLRLQSLIAGVLSCPVDRVSVSHNSTRSDNLLVGHLDFVGTPSVVDTRNNGRLGTIFMAYQESYLYSQLGVKQRYFADTNVTGDGSSSAGDNGAAAAESRTYSALVVVTWVVGVACFIGLVIGGYFFVMHVKQAKIGGLVRLGRHPVKHNRYGVIQKDGSRNGDDSDDEGNMMEMMGGGGASFGNNASITAASRQQFPNATEMFKRRQEQLAARRGGGGGGGGHDGDVIDEATHPEAFLQRPMSLQEFVDERMCKENTSARRVRELLDGAQRRMMDPEHGLSQDERAVRLLEKEKDAARVEAAEALLRERASHEEVAAQRRQALHARMHAEYHGVSPEFLQSQANQNAANKKGRKGHDIDTVMDIFS